MCFGVSGRERKRFSHCGNPEKLQAFSESEKPVFQCAMSVLMYAINLHKKILIAMPDEFSAVLCLLANGESLTKHPVPSSRGIKSTPAAASASRPRH